jgi:hypothetical protein
VVTCPINPPILLVSAMLVVISISETNVTHHLNTSLDERLSKDYDA